MPRLRLLLAACLLPSLLIAVPGPAQADSWAPPSSKVKSSPDGRWYVIVKPGEKWRDVRFTLVERAKDKPRHPDYEGTFSRDDAKAPTPDAGDRIAASGKIDWPEKLMGQYPVEIFCLDGGTGFLFFEQWGSVGMGESVVRLDAKGKYLWSKGLDDLFPIEIRKDFSRSVSSIWWNEAVWLDVGSADLVLAWGNRAEQHGVIRVATKDGARREAELSDVLAFLQKGSSGDRERALRVARKWKLPGLGAAVQKAFADKSTPNVTRIKLAEALLASGDKRGKDVVVFFAGPDAPLEARRAALALLGRFLPAQEAIPTLIAAVRDEDREVRLAARLALRGIGAPSTMPLVKLMEDETASLKSRAEAATTLWNMGVDAKDALPALKRASESAPGMIRQVAIKAFQHVREAVAKQRR